MPKQKKRKGRDKEPLRFLPNRKMKARPGSNPAKTTRPVPQATR